MNFTTLRALDIPASREEKVLCTADLSSLPSIYTHTHTTSTANVVVVFCSFLPCCQTKPGVGGAKFSPPP